MVFGGDALYTAPENGKSLYESISYGPTLPGISLRHQGREVSFNRPYGYEGSVYRIYDTAGGTLFAYDYNMIRWLEKSGYDVTYQTDIDTHTADSANGRLSPGRHKVFFAVGHDEYWSWEMRDNIEAARDRSTQPLNLGFFTGNACYWQIRFAKSSPTGTLPADEQDRTIIAYKETAKSSDSSESDPLFANSDIADNDQITNKWRENSTNGGPFPKPPEDALMGVMFSEVPFFAAQRTPP